MLTPSRTFSSSFDSILRRSNHICTSCVVFVFLPIYSCTIFEQLVMPWLHIGVILHQSQGSVVKLFHIKPNQFLSSFSVAPPWTNFSRHFPLLQHENDEKERKPVRCWQFSSTSNRSCTPDRLHHEEYGYIWYEVYELSDADHPS